ncbi:OmpW family outer membrane protein [Alteromonas facilis]|uniref:OmpW family outer membrane protein n=1 Tax=Alteromonas facilis TaxID=2048004 RepID=UPI000C285C1F|nr:OmpW family outer membrane protein [Alteromonas facilis]
MKKTTLALALAAIAIAPSAFAYEKGDMLVRGGLTTVAPDDSSSNILVGGADFALGGQTVGGVNVDNNTQLGLNFAYFFADNWNVEVLAATPFSHDIGIGGGINLGSTKHLPPTVTANYFFADKDAQFQPYVGVGLNYTIFFDEEFNGATVDVIEGATGGAVISDLDLDASLGFSVQVGADYFIDKNMFINASVRYIDIETEASFKVNGSDLGKIDTVTIDPWVYTISVGYKF